MATRLNDYGLYLGMPKPNSQTNLYDHSEAKVNLYSNYLSIYLNVLHRANMKRIYLYDLFCGEGVYDDGGKGSPIIALECIKNHFYANGQSCPNVCVTFNDAEKSQIEPEKWKAERVKELAQKIFVPDTVQVGYTKIEYQTLIKKVIERSNQMGEKERALVFIDPWGYKEIDPEDIKHLLSNSKTEVILFLPIYFMSRFANKSKKDLDYKGGEALRRFLGKLYGGLDRVPHVESQKKFIYQTQEQFKKYLGVRYVDSFKIERDNDNNWFAIYFFTNSERGFEKMLEAKWRVDKKRGSEFKAGDSVALPIFEEREVAAYDQKVLKLIQENAGVTNRDLKRFGLENNFLPKHTKAVLDDLRKYHSIEITALDGKTATSYYLGDDERLVNIKCKS